MPKAGFKRSQSDAFKLSTAMIICPAIYPCSQSYQYIVSNSELVVRACLFDILFDMRRILIVLVQYRQGYPREMLLQVYRNNLRAQHNSKLVAGPPKAMDF